MLLLASKSWCSSNLQPHLLPFPHHPNFFQEVLSLSLSFLYVCTSMWRSEDTLSYGPCLPTCLFTVYGMVAGLWASRDPCLSLSAPGRSTGIVRHSTAWALRRPYGCELRSLEFPCKYFLPTEPLLWAFTFLCGYHTDLPGFSNFLMT